MPERPVPVIAYSCPQCEREAVAQRELEPRRLLDWEDTLWVDLIFECTNCEWSQLVGRYPVNAVTRY